jgi:N-sulfoglucosamine sulfohydrolase
MVTKKRIFSLMASCWLLTGTCWGASAEYTADELKQPDKRPNILFVFADDWGCYSESYAKIEASTPWNQFAPTPHFDRIAQEGVLFRNAYVNAPQCTPSRSSLLTGQYFYRTGLAAVQDGIWDFTNPSFPIMLRDAGYHAGYTSKVWSPGTPTNAPYGGEEYEYKSAGTQYDKFSQNIYKQVEQGVSIEEAKQKLFAQVLGNFEQFLGDREAGQPFCYWFGGRNPHREWIKGSGKKLWGIDPDSLKGNMPPFLPDVHEVREDLADYFGENLAFDRMLGVLLEKLEAIGELENTLIVVSGDHGAPGFTYGKCNLYDFGTRVCLAVRWGKNPKPGRVVDDYVNLMDIAPTLLEAADVAVPDVMTGNSLIEQLTSTKEGQIDTDRTWVVTGRERHVSPAREGMLPYPQRSYRTDDYLYIINFKPDRFPGGNPWNITAESAPSQHDLEHDTFITHPDMDGGPTKAFLVMNRNNPQWSDFYHMAFGKRPREELYDLKKDPNQMKNVAGLPEYADVQTALEEKLLKVLRDTDDPRVQGDGSRFDKMPYTFEKWRSK